MTDTVSVERIDIRKGPTLKGLIAPWMITEAAMPPGNQLVAVRFDHASYYASEKDRTPIEELGSIFLPVLTGIERLGGSAMTRTRADYIITVQHGLGTFTGHYNTKTRSGRLRLK